MTGKLDWKWIGIGVIIMVVLSVVASLILGLVLRQQLQGATTPEEINLSGGQMLLALIINILIFLIGGFIVGVKSAGRTILEPGISALIAVLIALIISRQLTIMSLLVSGLVPFVAGVLGGWLGERRQGSIA